MIDLLMRYGADIHFARSSDSKTILHLAVSDIKAQDIKPILRHIADYNSVDSQGNTPLHLASDAFVNDCVDEQIRYKADMISDLLKYGAEPTIRNKKGLTPIHLLAGNSNTHSNSGDPSREFFHQLLRSRVLPDLMASGANLDCVDYDGRSILLRAVTYKGNKFEKLIPILVDLGADIDAHDYQGDTALHLFCRTGTRADIVEWFIERGANILATNNAGNTALHEIGRARNVRELANLLLKKGLAPTIRNNAGQTPLHMICGTLVNQELTHNLQTILNTDLAKGLKLADNQGVQPIHLAASLSEDYVGLLIIAGADPAAITKEGRTALHIAALCRQSNLVGHLIDTYASTGQMDLINHQDDSGLTALHEACKSGRPETVKLLLDANARIDLKAQLEEVLGNTPLHACALFEQEKIFWSPIGRQLASAPSLDAAGVMLGDTSRPPCEFERGRLSRKDKKFFDPISVDSTDTHTARVRDIVDMLIDCGADVSTKNCIGFKPISWALDLGCEEVVDRLSPHMAKVYADEESDEQSEQSKFRRLKHKFPEAYFSLREKHALDILELEGKQGAEITTLCGQLLKLGKFETLTRLPQMGIDFIPKPREGNFLEILTSCGYSSVLQTLGETVQESWVEGRFSSNKYMIIFPFLASACQRTLPNLEVIKVLVEGFGANINAAGGFSVFLQRDMTETSTALQLLATRGHWWQVKAMEYFLERGADPDVRDNQGRTALHVAVSSGRPYTRKQVVNLLLKYGSNPNAVSSIGVSCLSNVINDVGMMSILIGHGVDVDLGTKPAIFSAIEHQRIDAVELLLNFKANPNCRLLYHIEYERKSDLEHEQYPLLAAASDFFDLAKLREQSIAIIRLLLLHGADPYLVFNNGREETTIVHHILERGGVLQPFFDIEGLHLEHRDAQGRTLLLAACKSRFGTVERPVSSSREKHLHVKQENINARQAEEKISFTTQLILAHRLYELGSNLLVQDNDGNNVLHLLLSKTPCENSKFDEAVTLFIQKAPSLIDQRNEAGFTPLHIACKNKRIFSINTLIAAGGEIKEADPNGNTIAHFLAEAMRSSDLEEELINNFKYFLSLGVPVNSSNVLGETPIFWFFKSDPGAKVFTELSLQTITAALLDLGADLFHKNCGGETLLHIVAARFCGNTVPKEGFLNTMKKQTELFERKIKDTAEEFKWLLGKGLDPTIEDMAHRTALDVASASGNEAILQLFKSEKGQ